MYPWSKIVDIPLFYVPLVQIGVHVPLFYVPLSKIIDIPLLLCTPKWHVLCTPSPRGTCTPKNVPLAQIGVHVPHFMYPPDLSVYP